MTKEQLKQKLLALAIEADEAGFVPTSSVLLLIVRGLSFPSHIAKRLVNAGHLMVDVAER